MDADGVMTFSGEMSSTLTGSKVSGFYPADNVYLNHATSASTTHALSTLRLVQPSYLKYEYSNGAVTPASIGDYCYMHVESDQVLSSDASELSAHELALCLQLSLFFQLCIIEEGSLLLFSFLHLNYLLKCVFSCLFHHCWS